MGTVNARANGVALFWRSRAGELPIAYMSDSARLSLSLGLIACVRPALFDARIL